MKRLDTNVIVRYLVRDDEEQWKIANQLLNSIVEASDVCLINNIVLCELIWVLRSSYKLNRSVLINTLEKLLKTNVFVFENKAAAWWAVQQMKQGNADFSDYLIARLNQQQGCTETVTFDTKLQGIKGIQLLAKQT